MLMVKKGDDSNQSLTGIPQLNPFELPYVAQ